MNFLQLNRAIILMLTLLTVGILHASNSDTLNEQAKLSIQTVNNSSRPESGLISCRNTLANCLVTMTFNIPNTGFVTILNASRIDAINVRATLPSAWNGDVLQTSICDVIKAGESCSLIFQTTSATSSPHAVQTIPVQGDNTTKVYFDMIVVP
ncbi:hypothetical protein ELY21_00285 [Legionella sp. km535]|uniref:hypothetical protein n=1 Tax=Legionella sp. km535 TaxID=2498107 RepID=UPI000F8D508A|nr:hypothetical protein [Legionella sp. km535]RUR20562.1 hypothetical protein ELY21_00285 [Legionella sp. km535]